MTRSGYTQIATSADVRSDDIAVVCALTHRDVGNHGHRVDCYDDALRYYRAHLERNKRLSLQATLEAFVASDEFIPAIVKSTQASYDGGYYAVELFTDGHHRVLWSAEIGNRYESPGAIVRVPGLTPEDGDDLTEAAEFYREDIAEQMRVALEAMFIDE
jgi:hypothetical protein